MNVTVVVEYTLKPTPEVPVPVLAQAEVEVKLFIRVQVDVIPWFSGERPPRALRGRTVCVLRARYARYALL